MKRLALAALALVLFSAPALAEQVQIIGIGGNLGTSTQRATVVTSDGSISVTTASVT